MKTEEDESAPRVSSGAGGNKGKKKRKRTTTHNHVGPNVRAYRAGRAFCPSCDAEKVLRLTDKERESERAAQQAAIRDPRRK